MVRFTNILLSIGIVIVTLSFCISLEVHGFVAFVALFTSYSISYYILRYIRVTGIDLEVEKEIEQLTNNLQESEAKNNKLEMEIKRIEDKLEMQKELVELSKQYSKY
jgi:cell division protein FtsB